MDSFRLHGTKGFHEGWYNVEVWLDGKELTPEYSLTIRDHSPDGFSWGYGGSGPSQLALAVCLDIFSRETHNVEYIRDLAIKNYMDFRDQVIGKIPQDENQFDIVFWHNGNKWMVANHA